MGRIKVLNQNDLMLKAFFTNVVEPSIIMKGDGVLYMGPEGNTLMGFPPQHLFNMDPHQQDHPMWSWNPHTGEKIEGGMHPIDGAAFHLQEYLHRAGIKDADAQQIIEEAIEAFNRNHISDKHHLPPFNSPEWRKLVVGPHPTNVQSHEISTRSRDGKLFTHYGNRGGQIGFFPESGAIPFHKELNKILTDMGLPHAHGELEFVYYPNISAQHLAPNLYRTKKGELSAHGMVPHHILERFGPEGAGADAAHGPLHTWEVMRHLPPAMFMGSGYAPRANSATVREAEAHMTKALQRIDPQMIPETPITLHDGTQTTFREAVLHSETRNTLIHDMARSPALQFLFAGAGSPSTPTKTRGIMGPMLDVEGMDIHGSHTSTGTPMRGRSPHSYGAKVGAAAAAHGPSEHDPTRSAMAFNPEGLKEGADMEEIGRRRDIIEAMASTMSRAHGHQDQWVPDWENLPTEMLFGRGIGNLGQVLHESVPSHFENRFYTDMTTAPMRPTLIPQGAGHGPSEIEPPAPPQPAAPLPQPAATASPEVAVMRPTRFIPQAPELQDWRRQVGQAPPEQRREMIEQAGLRIPTLPHRAQQFMDVVGDPAQTTLTQWKSEDIHNEMLDRIEKAMEELQLKDALQDNNVLKYIPTKRHLNLNSESDVSLMASKLGLTKHDIRSLAVSKGDWHRVADVFKVPPPVVGAVKVVFS